MRSIGGEIRIGINNFNVFVSPLVQLVNDALPSVRFAKVNRESRATDGRLVLH